MPKNERGTWGIARGREPAGQAIVAPISLMMFTYLAAPIAALLFTFSTLRAVAATASESPEVFHGPPAAYETPLAPLNDSADHQPLRLISVEERAGVDRTDDLVRVPLFFAQGECRDLAGLNVVPVGAGASPAKVVFQTDDVRLGPDGGISRVHLWFPVSLKAGEKRQFQLVHRKPAAGKPDVSPMKVAKTTEGIAVTTDTGAVDFTNDGALRRIASGASDWDFGAAGALPSTVVTVPAHDGVPAARLLLDRDSANRTVEWGTGPVFTKLRVSITAADGVEAEQIYRIPRHGREMVISHTVFPGPVQGAEVKANEFLDGGVTANVSVAVQKIPAGIRFGLRGEHAYSVTALARNSSALLAVPLVIGGGNGDFESKEPGAFKLRARGGLQRGGEGEKETLHAYWSEVRLVPAATNDPTELWKLYRAHVQPLVAVVEEPGASVERLHTALLALAWEMKPVGWRQDAGRLLMAGDLEKMKKMVPHTAMPKQANVEELVAGAVNSTAKLTNNGQRKLREDEKGRAYGALDPYHVTYTQSAAAAIAVLTDAPPGVSAVNLAMAKGVHQVGARVDAAGFPYIDCFSRTLNMQLGPVLFGLTAGKAAGNAELVRFYRDLATAPPTQAVFGRAQRPYTGAQATTPDQTDFLYQSIADFWLRTTELLAGEKLDLHPLMYARYTDCIDVMADVYHGVASRDKPGASGLARANFFRGQVHTHRWLGWSCAPFIRLLEDPAENGKIGLTEATHFADAMKGRWKNWPDLTFYILADVLVREGLAHSKTIELPAIPANVLVRRDGSQATISWQPVPGAANYRIYRATRPGGPHQWLNSPYVEHPAAPTTEPHFTDTISPTEATYFVTAVDAEGHASSWADSP